MAALPTGTVTFLFTDIEGSTRLLQELGHRYARLLADHHRLLRVAFAECGGSEVQDHGDGFYYSFRSAKAAVQAAVAAQRAVVAHPWPDGVAVRVRMGLHTGEPTSGETGLVGIDIHRAARICAAGHGGQILVSQATRELVGDDPHDSLSLRDLGEHRLKDLARAERIFQIVAADLPADFPPLRSLDVLPNNLPLQLTSFIGREREIAEVRRLLTTTRLLTLTGVGGCGKTRLTLQVAAEVLDDFPDGVWLVELAPLSDPALIPHTVASVLQIREEPGRPILSAMIDVLREKHLLLILDNCEHLLAAGASLADALLHACAHVRILVTSREALGVAGETTFHVPSLSIPDLPSLPVERLADFEAIHLFLDRASAARPDFTLNGENAAAVATICQRLDGIPLAIELAAPRVKALTVEQIAERLHDSFRLLTGGSRTALPRQQTLQAAMDWSYDLLSAPERTLLRRLSVFAGGFTLEAVESVCSGQGIEAADVVDLLTRLVEKSLVAFQEREGRYRLLETVRQYGHERLVEAGEADIVRRKHCDHFLGIAETAPLAASPFAYVFVDEVEALKWLDHLEAEHDNLRAALAWSLDTAKAETALRLAGALERFWFLRGHWTEGRAWLDRSLSQGATASPALRARVLFAAGKLAWEIGDSRASVIDLLQQSADLYRGLKDKRGMAASLSILAAVVRNQGDTARAVALYEESLAYAKEAGDTHRIGFISIQMGTVVAPEDLGRAVELYEQGLTMARELGLKFNISAALQRLGGVAVAQGELRRAAQLYGEAEACAREVASPIFLAAAHTALGSLARIQGDQDRARVLLEEAVAVLRQRGGTGNLAGALDELGWLELDRGDYARATALFEESLTLGRGMGFKPSVAGAQFSLGSAAAMQRDFERAETLLGESLAMFRDMRSKPEIAACLRELGKVALEKGDSERAASLYSDSLGLLRERGARLAIIPCLEGLAEVAMAGGRRERAARLLGAAAALRDTMGAPVPLHARPDYERCLSMARAALGEQQFSARWAEGGSMTMERAVEYALSE